VVNYSLEKVGCHCSDMKVRRLIALAAQRFLVCVATDAAQYLKLRTTAPSAKKQKWSGAVLTMDDLCSALDEQGIPVFKPDYYADRLNNPNPDQDDPAET